MRHERTRRAAEKIEQIVDQAPMRRLTRDNRLEDVRVADLLDLPHGAFFFETANDGLDGGIGRALLLRQRFLNLAHRRAPQLPERIHNLQLEASKFDLLLAGHGGLLSSALLQLRLS